MIQTADQQETMQTLKNKIITLYNYLIEHHDVENAEKIKQLAKKLESREFMIAFCGHFSAGKSTMINKVVGDNLLPSSPIPTSANLVKVKSGEEYAKVFFKNEKPRLYLAPYDYELVKKYCKDGDQIEEIEISHSETALPANTVIMDTPGIDSADDAHRLATESAIHLADLVLYVMDYNHVQAELNFLFTKDLTEAGKEVYLVINQVDKHNEEELHFHDFKQSVIDSFSAWGVKPTRVFYTSLKYQKHKRNEFNELKHFIAQRLKTKDRFLNESISRSLQKIAEDHLKKSQTILKKQYLPKVETVNELSAEERSQILKSYQEVQTNLQTLTSGVEETEHEFDTAINEIMKNSYLMPFQTRVLAEAFLEANQSEFKVGFLFYKQKTLEEKRARLDRFYQEILEKTKSQLEWHLREYLLESLKEKGLDNQELRAKAQSFSIQVPIELLADTVKQGARLSGEYVLHYTEDLASGIKKIARNRIAEFKTSFIASLEDKTLILKGEFQKENRKIEQNVKALAELKKFEEETARKEKIVHQLLTGIEVRVEDSNQLFNQEEEEFEVIQTQFRSNEVDQSTTKPNIALVPVKAENKTKEELPLEGSQLNTMVERLERSSKLVKDLPGFQKSASELAEKADRLAHKGFTVALFGAFSAGKSSFANALLGEKVLPVSPNPTTAAINKIKPVTDKYSHGTVRVKFKEETAMLADVNRSLKLFDFQTTYLAGASNEIEKVMIEKGQEGVVEKTHFAFLQAFNLGYNDHGTQLGTVLETDFTEFAEFVAKEERSCFVEWIELYYDCELTRKGITLVDTPGADSINARHTGVAFDYIKNSDAILFVTYYNHAFSKADREFLIQLGRVKESFQLDKMFFIINAIDLAENEEEKETVADYVKEQLVKYGIRNPHLYPLSSLLALKEKLQRETDTLSGMDSFESDFGHFIANDLTEMAVTAAGSEINRVNKLIRKLIDSSREDQLSKEKRKADIEKQKTMINEFLEKQTDESLQKLMKQEVEELLYYIKQRVFFRFNDFFKEAFNPSTLRDDGRDLQKGLHSALDELLECFGFDFAQEMRATTLRLDRFAEKVLSDYDLALKRGFAGINQDLAFSTFEMIHEGEIEFQLAFTNINKKLFLKAMSYFKNPKAFFEKNEKKLMIEELTHILNTPTDEYLKAEGERLADYFAVKLTAGFNRILNQVEEQTADFYFSLHSAIDGGIPVEKLIEIHQEMGENI